MEVFLAQVFSENELFCYDGHENDWKYQIYVHPKTSHALAIVICVWHNGMIHSQHLQIHTQDLNMHVRIFKCIQRLWLIQYM